MDTRRLDGAPVAESIFDSCRRRIRAGVADGRPPPQLVSVHRGGPTPFAVYLRRQQKLAAAVELGFRDVPLPDGAGAIDLASTVVALDGDSSVHGVLVEHPLPAELEFGAAVGRLRPEKDVDGVGVTNLGRLIEGRPTQVPAVARAALSILRHYEIPLAGRRVTIVGRSPSVGLPLAILLLARGADATVTVAHSQSRDLAASLRTAEVVISCAGKPGLLDRSNVPEGSVVIDVGLSTVQDPSTPSGTRMAGDVDALSLGGWASALSPVPGGVGPVTVACLLENAVHGWELLTGGA